MLKRTRDIQRLKKHAKTTGLFTVRFYVFIGALGEATMKTVQFRLATLLFVLLLVGCGSKESTQSSGDTWKMFHSPEGKFSVLFPSNPTAEVSQISICGGAVPYHKFAVGLDYLAGYLDLPLQADSTKFCKGFEDSFFVSYKLLNRYEFKSGNISAIELDLKGKQYSLRVRYFLNGRRIYTVGVSRPLAEPDRGDFTMFLGSFKLDEQ